ncbi:MAG: hypothetical protein ABL908_20895 [Hyphomicrobium sp.]
MSWHQTPSDDAWRAVHPDHVASLGQQLWLRCGACGHAAIEEPLAFADRHKLDRRTPLLLIARRLCCNRCGERKAHCWPKPYGIGDGA